MKQHLVILADDLTGAADCAVPFVRSGLPTEVFLQPQLVKETEAPVVSVDLNTRELTPGQAVQATSRAFTSAGIEHPRIGICGINPHAGESGLFGRGEEQQKILPAVESCQKKRLGCNRSSARGHPVF